MESPQHTDSINIFFGVISNSIKSQSTGNDRVSADGKNLVQKLFQKRETLVSALLQSLRGLQI